MSVIKLSAQCEAVEELLRVKLNRKEGQRRDKEEKLQC